MHLPALSSVVRHFAEPLLTVLLLPSAGRGGTCSALVPMLEPDRESLLREVSQSPELAAVAWVSPGGMHVGAVQHPPNHC
jgi:hypothetical protein